MIPGPVEGDRRSSSPLALVSTALGRTAGVMVAAMMFLIAADVVGRYFLNRPVFGAFEMIEVLMGLVIFAGLPLATAARQNISVTVVSDALPARWKRWQLVASDLCCALASALMAWRMWVYGTYLAGVGETTLELQISRGRICQAMALLLVVTTVVFVANARAAFRRTNLA